MSASMVKVDARGVSCPEPVIMTKKALQENRRGVEVVVDNVTAKSNIERFAKISGFTAESRVTGSDYIITITKKE